MSRAAEFLLYLKLFPNRDELSSGGTKAEANQVWCAAGTAPFDSRGLDSPGMRVEFLLRGSPVLKGQQCRVQRSARACCGFPASALSGKDFEDPGL